MTSVSTSCMPFRLLRAAGLGLLLSLAAGTVSLSAAEARRAEPTRTLFRYQRNDRTPNRRTLARINAAHAAAPISPLVFGNFLEHLGSAIYGGVWSQLLTNPNLEPIAGSDRTPPGWEM